MVISVSERRDLYLGNILSSKCVFFRCPTRYLFRVDIHDMVFLGSEADFLSPVDGVCAVLLVYAREQVGWGRCRRWSEAPSVLPSFGLIWVCNELMFVYAILSVAMKLIAVFIYAKSFIRVIIRILMKENNGNSIFIEFPAMIVFGLYDKRTRLVNISTLPIYTCQC